ncbi:chaperone protein dnaJ 8, chloroplastic-like [Triticum aestivum]|nr:chaperone protein dnaJ 8, chloroplastic-like [Triticum aestivum]
MNPRSTTRQTHPLQASSNTPFQLHHAVNRRNNTSGSKTPSLPQLRRGSSPSIDLAIDSVSCRACAHSTSMAVAGGGGGMALSLRAPSTSASPAVGRLRRAASSPAVRCGATRERWPAAAPYRVLEEDHYRTLRLQPGASRGEVKKAFHRLALQYHPDVVRQDDGIDFERINAAYQKVMSNMREAEATLEYWRRRYGLADEDLDRYRHYLNEEDEDDWFSDFRSLKGRVHGQRPFLAWQRRQRCK